MSLILKVLDPEELISGPQARTLGKVCNILRRPIIGDITWNALCDSQYGESVSAFLLPYLGDKTVMQRVGISKPPASLSSAKDACISILEAACERGPSESGLVAECPSCKFMFQIHHD